MSVLERNEKGQVLPGQDPFAGGKTGARGRGRPHFLGDPENVKLVAEAFAAGMTRKDMAAEFGMSDPGTITRWRKDPRIKAEVRKIVNDRILRISSKTDSVIESRLAEASEMTIDDLIKIRKEFGGSALARVEVDEDALVNEAMEALESNPDLLAELQSLLERAKQRQDDGGDIIAPALDTAE